MGEPLRIKGRTRYSGEATTTVEIYRYPYEPPLMVIEGGMFEEHGQSGGFTLLALHRDGTDVEHDAAHLARFTGAGLIYQGMMPGRVRLTGALLEAQFYSENPEPTGQCVDCPEPHPFLPYLPPRQKWKPALYHFEVLFHGPIGEEKA